MRRIFRIYFVPGLVLQSVVIGGGYGTGREIVEFLLSQGAVGGLLGLLVATIVWSTTLAVSFELARISGAYDYKTFIKQLLGPAWFVFELVFLVGLLLVLSVVGAASGELVHSMTGAPNIVGIIVAMIAISFIVFKGSDFITKLFAIWAIFIYIGYAALIIFTLSYFSDDALSHFGHAKDTGNWAFNGAKYAALNVGIVPAILFSVRHLRTRRETLIAGALSGPIIMAPALLLFLSLLSLYPGILSEAIPTNALLAAIDIPFFTIFFQILLLGTIIDTGAAFVHGFNERLAQSIKNQNRPFTALHRAGLGLIIFAISAFIAERIGLISLVSHGYGAFTLISIAVFLVPVLTWGIWQVIRAERDQQAQQSIAAPKG
ncbi:hypothetical protein [Parasphingorhabdus sp.]|uniref:hypothetical protein n=1 Tax=Parasphingorhabdus sp. TaxID=2709688 RepID=UPI003265AC76